MSDRDSRLRRWALRFWRIANPLARPFAGFAPWWALLETTGRRSGKARRIPIATGPRDPGRIWLVSMHGSHSAFALNIAADPKVRIRTRGRWHDGVAQVVPIEPELERRLNLYIRTGIRLLGIDPMAVRIVYATDA